MVIESYAVHAQGISHAEAGKPCQDAYAIRDCGSGITVAAIADGLGSCAQSQKSSRKAVDSICDFIVDELPTDPSPQVLSAIMIAGMNHAFKDVLRMLSEESIELKDAQTTLSAVIFHKEGVVFGHAGDGVVIGLEEDGTYSVICEPYKGDLPNSTFPFTKGWKSWHAGTVDRPFASVLLATDGVGDVIYPPFLRPDHEVIVKHAAFFMHPSRLGLKKGETLDEQSSKELSESTLSAIRNPQNKTWSSVTDDLTAAILIDPDADPPVIEDNQTEEYLRGKFEVFYDIASGNASDGVSDAGACDKTASTSEGTSDNRQKTGAPKPATVRFRIEFWKRKWEEIIHPTKKTKECSDDNASGADDMNSGKVVE